MHSTHKLPKRNILARTTSVDYSRYSASGNRTSLERTASTTFTKDFETSKSTNTFTVTKKRLTRTDKSVVVQIPTIATSDNPQDFATPKDETARSTPVTGHQYTKQPIRKTRSMGAHYPSTKDVSDLPEGTQVEIDTQHDRGESKVDSSGANSAWASCPNLLDNGPNAVGKTKVRITRSSEGYFHGNIYRSGSSSAKSERSCPKLLTVPDIFVTSLTYSSDVESDKTVRQTKGGEGESQLSPKKQARKPGPFRYSAPELTARGTGDHWERLREYKSPLKKSLSDTSPRLAKTPDGDLSALQIRREGPTEPLVAQVLDNLYIGNLETAYNERLLCRMSIGSVVDLSNLPPEEVPASSKCNVPCACGRDDRHLRATLRIGLHQSDMSDVESSFEQVNKFIEGARKAAKNVLVFCRTGNSISAVVVIQYLMAHRSLYFRKAYAMVMRQRSDLHLPPGYLPMLQALEKKQLQPRNQSLPLEAVPNRDEATCLPKEAWIVEEGEVGPIYELRI